MQPAQPQRQEPSLFPPSPHPAGDGRRILVVDDTENNRIMVGALGLPQEEAEILRHAITMHDVGKIGIPDAILTKPGRLTEDERTLIRSHTSIGGRILADSRSELMRAGEVIAVTHHEKWDGSGYPRGLAGEEIPLMGRLCAVLDVFDALTTQRPYRLFVAQREEIFAVHASLGEEAWHKSPQAASGSLP